ncbi:hypothetical protein GCM10025864_38350 [Luteimicrobium album]|uniref:Uncharacterized protein n=1 Tax=Luteimicrobium album TaxID=1054550 RepID=A0ABQ6I5W4_9MICO|nr:hypothetical protein GCM10025864_38350 [Luteimicrobium album]
MVPVEEHDVLSPDELVDVTGRRDLDPAAVGRDDGPLPVRSSTATAETARANPCGATSTTRTPCASRSSRAADAAAPVPSAATSVADPPSAANTTAALAAGPPAATSWRWAVTLVFGSGGALTRWTTSSVVSPTNSPDGRSLPAGGCEVVGTASA